MIALIVAIAFCTVCALVAWLLVRSMPFVGPPKPPRRPPRPGSKENP